MRHEEECAWKAGRHWEFRAPSGDVMREESIYLLGIIDICRKPGRGHIIRVSFGDYDNMRIRNHDQGSNEMSTNREMPRTNGGGVWHRFGAAEASEDLSIYRRIENEKASWLTKTDACRQALNNAFRDSVAGSVKA